jgi:ribosomal protein S4E
MANRPLREKPVACTRRPALKSPISMTANSKRVLKNGAQCTVTGGTHAGKSGIVNDINTSKTGHVTITVVQANGVRFKTLAKNLTLD